MNPEPLPPDWHDLEDRLARRPCPEPAADFRTRVLRATTTANALPDAERAGRRWGLVWRAAAAVVLALNLGMSAANGVRFQQLTPLAQRQAEPATALGVKDPFQAWAARALANWVPAPDVGALTRNYFSEKEDGTWAMP